MPSRLPDLLIDLEIARTEGNSRKVMAWIKHYASKLAYILWLTPSGQQFKLHWTGGSDAQEYSIIIYYYFEVELNSSKFSGFSSYL